MSQLLLRIHQNQRTGPADDGSVDPHDQLAGTSFEWCLLPRGEALNDLISQRNWQFGWVVPGNGVYLLEGEEGCVHIALLEPKSDEKNSQLLKPLSICLFETIDGLLKFADRGRRKRVRVALRDLHINFFMKITMEKSIVLGGGGGVSVGVENEDVVSGSVGVVLVAGIVGDGVVISDGVGGGFVMFIGGESEGDVGSDVMGVFGIGVCEVCGGAG
ncbi:hypothetical protein Tco_1245018 [Tanacetum coccineum]